MDVCPRCQGTVAADALTCPRCHASLKAFGHPGISLYRAEGEAFLCPSCLYHQDDSCNFPQRPLAKTCTLYKDVQAITPKATYRIPWWRRHGALIALGGLVGLSLMLVLAAR